MKYLATKVLKRLETNKLRGGFKDPLRTLLLPISFGVSSITLLHVLDQQLRNRLEQNRHAGYTLHILFVDQSTVVEQTPLGDLLDLLKQRYPSHTYTAICLENCSDYNINIEEILKDETLTTGEDAGDHRQQMKQLLLNLLSATSKTDIIDIVRRRLIFAFAKEHGCDSILFGDSTTRLAEKTLSEAAKGRGIALPWLTADGSTLDGIICTFPLRDLLRKELTAYTTMASPPLTSLILESTNKRATSSKDTTIDDLMSQYFESVEQNYPSIVANVVRTSSRLVAPSATDDAQSCSVCGQSIVTEAWAGEQESIALRQCMESTGPNHAKAVCYGCARTVWEP